MILLFTENHLIHSNGNMFATFAVEKKKLIWVSELKVNCIQWLAENNDESITTKEITRDFNSIFVIDFVQLCRIKLTSCRNLCNIIFWFNDVNLSMFVVLCGQSLFSKILNTFVSFFAPSIKCHKNHGINSQMKQSISWLRIHFFVH